MPAAARAEVESGLVDALRRARFEVVTAESAPEAFSATPCGSAKCVLEVAKATEASHVLQVWITQDGRDYEVRTVVWSARDGLAVATVKQVCEICGVAELVEMIADQSTSLENKLQTIPGTLAVHTSPGGALVRIDGRVVGVSPIVETLPPGDYSVVIEKDGFHTRRRDVSLVEGGEEAIDLVLQVDQTTQKPVPGKKGKKSVLRPLGWAGFGVGLGVLGAGIPLLVLHHRPVKNRCTSDNIGEDGVCRFRYNTVVPGATLVAIGGALVVTGIALVAVHARRKSKANNTTGTKIRAQALFAADGGAFLLRF